MIAAAAAVCVFSAGVLFGELNGGRVPAVADAIPVAAPAAVPAPTPTPPPASTPTPTPTPTVTMPAPVDVLAVERPVDARRAAPPVQVTIPGIGIDQGLIGLRVTSDRRMQVPESFADIGWWSDGPSPGDPGAALLVGHVDSQEGPAVFYDLPRMEQGAVIAVRRADGTTVRFAVTDMQSFPKDDFPDELVYRTEGKPSLHLVTCGGSFDQETGHYRDNVVVFADLIEEVPEPVIEAQPPVSTPGEVTAEEKARADNANAAIAEALAGPPVPDVPDQDQEVGR